MSKTPISAPCELKSDRAMNGWVILWKYVDPETEWTAGEESVFDLIPLYSTNKTC